MSTDEVYYYAFRITLLMVVVGFVLGVSAIWFEDFWHNDVSYKLILTTALLFVTSLGVTIITKFLQ